MPSRSGFEHLAVGDTLELAVEGGSAGLDAVGAVLADLVDGSGCSPASVTWRPHNETESPSVDRARVTVTRLSPPDRPEGQMGLHLALLAGDGTTVGQAEVVLSGARADRYAVATDFGTVEWGRALADVLAGTEFESATRTVDGAIGLQAGGSFVQLRIYRGRCVDIARTTPLGPTFTIRGADIEWVELAFAERNDFIARAMVDRFTADGDVFQYLRLNRAVNLIWEAVRELAGTER